MSRPLNVFSYLNEIQGKLADVVSEHDGRVDKFMGDGMLAVFGIPETKANDACRALDAAVLMVKAIKELSSNRELPIQLGVGIHSGPVIAGCLGGGLRLEFTVIGDTVNTASRLESLAKKMGLEVLLSREVRERVVINSEPVPSITSLGRVEIRGKQKSLEVYTVSDL
jgi:class 3 adenylate cyclase